MSPAEKRGFRIAMAIVARTPTTEMSKDSDPQWRRVLDRTGWNMRRVTMDRLKKKLDET